MSHTDFKILDTTIAEGASLSNAVLLQGYTIVAIKMPAAWTAAALSFQVTVDGENYADLYDEAGEYSVSTDATGASRVIALDTSDSFFGVLGVKVRSGVTAAAVNQEAARTISLVCRLI